MYKLYREQFLPISIEKAWNFFSAPQNLSLITPPEMRFNIISTDANKPIFEGMLIDYTISPIMGILLHWKTEITQVIFQKVFTDKQIKGPYKKWEHTHTFLEQEGGVFMKDELIYELPFSFIGTIAHALFVRKKIESIFDYRKNILDKIL
jgi:ligand-binding SRPBCC domain-containing protein